MSLHVVRRGAGPALLLLHGAYLSHAQWQPNINAFVDAGFTVIAPDLPAHGASLTLDGQLSVETMADAIVDGLHAESRFCCVGMGLGSMVAQAIALRHAGRAPALILADPSHGLRSTSLERFETDFTNAILRLSTVEWQAGLFARALTRQSPAARELVQQHLDRHAKDGASYRAIWDAFTGFDSLPALSQISQPTLLLVAGANARDARHARVMQQRMPAARTETIPDASHMMNVDNPAAFNSAVLGFVATAFNP